MAAKAAAPPGSAITDTSAQSRRWAWVIAESVTRTTLLTNRLAILKLSSPTRFAPSESAAIDLTDTSTGAFASSAA